MARFPTLIAQVATGHIWLLPGDCTQEHGASAKLHYKPGMATNFRSRWPPNMRANINGSCLESVHSFLPAQSGKAIWHGEGFLLFN